MNLGQSGQANKIASRKNNARLGYLLVFLAGSGWGTGGSCVTHLTSMGASPLLTGFTGHFFALPFLALAILIFLGPSGFKISKKGLFFAVIMGVLTKACFKMAYDTAIAITGISTSVVLLYTSPVFAAIFSILLYKEKLEGKDYLALAMNLLGVFLMVTLGDLSNFNVSGLGIFLGIVAAFLVAANTILAKEAGNEDDPITMSFYMLLFSAGFLGIFAKPWQAESLTLLTNQTFLFWAVVNAMVSGALSNLLYLKGMSLGVDTAKAPVVSSVEVIVSSLMGVFLFKEAMNLVGLLGISLMLVSIYLVNRTTKATVTE